jgi:[acyl-carrier-protein] S-malonyltransferase
MAKIAMLFPGQGSQATGMGKDIYDNYPAAAAVFQKANQTLGSDLASLCFNGPDELLKDTRNAQPAILTVSVALYRALAAEGVKADYLAGHSLGEYSALVASGAADFSVALQLVVKRAQFMAAADPGQNGTMAAVLGLDRERLQKCLIEASQAGPLEAANFNSPGQIVISGARSGMAKAQELVAAAGGKFIPLSVSGPFHSSFMKPAADEFRPELAAVSWREPQAPLIANVDARPASIPVLTENLYRQMYSPVLWEDTLQYLSKQGVTIFLEVGPGKVLSGLVKKTVKEATILNCDDSASLKKALAILEEV